MGVLACDRQGCESIMCDYHSYTYGYICYSCLNELRDRAGRDISSIEEFMYTPKYKDQVDMVDGLLNEIEATFQYRDDL